MLCQHMVTPGAILLLFGGYKMLVFLFLFFFKEILCWISQVHIIELPSGFLREQPCNHKLPSSNTVILHVQTTVWSSPGFLITRLSGIQDNTQLHTVYFERSGLPSWFLNILINFTSQYYSTVKIAYMKYLYSINTHMQCKG